MGKKNSLFFAIDLCLVATVLPFFAILINILFASSTNLVDVVNRLVQVFPFADFMVKVIALPFDPASLDLAVNSFGREVGRELINTWFMGSIFFASKVFLRSEALRKIPIFRSLMYFAAVLFAGLVVSAFNHAENLFGIIARIVISLAPILILYRIFRRGFKLSAIVKGLLGIYIDMIFAIIATLYLSTLFVCLTDGQYALNLGFTRFIVVTVVTIIAVGINSVVNDAIDKDIF